MLNDVTMLLHISQDHSHVEVVSFPRDMIVPVPECPDPVDPEQRAAVVDVGRAAQQRAPPRRTRMRGGDDRAAHRGDDPSRPASSSSTASRRCRRPSAGSRCASPTASTTTTRASTSTAGTHTIEGYEALAFLRTRARCRRRQRPRPHREPAGLPGLAGAHAAELGNAGDPVKLYSIAKVVVENMELSQRTAEPAEARLDRAHAGRHRPLEDRVRAVPDGLQRRRHAGRTVRIGAGRERRAAGRPCPSRSTPPRPMRPSTARCATRRPSRRPPSRRPRLRHPPRRRPPRARRLRHCPRDVTGLTGDRRAVRDRERGLSLPDRRLSTLSGVA